MRLTDDNEICIDLLHTGATPLCGSAGSAGLASEGCARAGRVCHWQWRDCYWKIIAHYGYAHQKEKTVEELGELQQAIARDLQGEADRANIAEEMADVYIMLSQLQLIYGNAPAIAQAIRVKLARTLERVEGERTGTHEPERH